jgi:hypothetical protein
MELTFQEKVDKLKNYYLNDDNFNSENKEIKPENEKLLIILPEKSIVYKNDLKYVDRINRRTLNYFNEHNVQYDIFWLNNKLTNEKELYQSINSSSYRYIIFQPYIIRYLKNFVKRDFSDKVLILLEQETIFLQKKSVINAFNEQDIINNNIGGVIYIDDEFKDPTNDDFRLISKFREFKIEQIQKELNIMITTKKKKEIWEI